MMTSDASPMLPPNSAHRKISAMSPISPSRGPQISTRLQTAISPSFNNRLANWNFPEKDNGQDTMSFITDPEEITF